MIASQDYQDHQTEPTCVECHQGVSCNRLNPLTGAYVCWECQERHPERYKLVSMTQAMTTHGVPASILEHLRHAEIQNRYGKSKRCRLYLLADVLEASRQVAALAEQIRTSRIGMATH